MEKEIAKFLTSAHTMVGLRVTVLASLEIHSFDAFLKRGKCIMVNLKGRLVQTDRILLLYAHMHDPVHLRIRVLQIIINCF